MRATGCTTIFGVMELRGLVYNQLTPRGITYYWETTNAPRSSMLAIMIGVQQANLPIACTRLFLTPLTSLSGTTDASGRGRIAFFTPDDPALHSTWIEFQAAAPDASQPVLPVALSNALRMRAQTLTPPTFNICSVVANGAGATTGVVLDGRAVVVRFN